MPRRTATWLAATGLALGALAALSPAARAEQPRVLALLTAAGLLTEVCALCLPNAGVGTEALIEGVGPAVPPEMARRMPDPHTRVLPF